MNALLAAAADAQKALEQGKGLFATAKAWCNENWYVSIPGAFVACFVVVWLWARWKWSR